MKKVFAIIISMMLLLSIAGCTSKSGTQMKNDTEPQPSVQPAAASAESEDELQSAEEQDHGADEEEQKEELIDFGPAPEDVPTEDMEVMYILVEAFGDDWIYGDDTKVICGKDHGYDYFDTVKVEYYKTDIANEPGTVTVNQFDDPYEAVYSRIIKKVVYSRPADPEAGEPLFDKPVICLYPEKETDVFVRLDFDGYFTETIPPYREGWHVVASPDGQLVADDGKTYPYLFWEGIPNREFAITGGFCVEGSKTREFFEKILLEIGLSGNETDEFIEYWLPRMENNAYNLIQFCGEDYLETAKLEVTPAPDSVLRVFMAYRSSDEYIPLEEQTFTPFVRKGFTVVEWGGTCLD